MCCGCHRSLWRTPTRQECHRPVDPDDGRASGVALTKRTSNAVQQAQSKQFDLICDPSSFPAAMSADAEQVRVELFNSLRQYGHAENPLKSTWCPHDQIEGRVVVTSKPDLRVDKISVSLLGMCCLVTCMMLDGSRWPTFLRFLACVGSGFTSDGDPAM